MKTIAVTDGVTINRDEAIKIYREAAKVSLEEASDVMDGVGNGIPAILEVEDSEVYDIIRRFELAGVETMIADGDQMVEAGTIQPNTGTTDRVVTEKFEPIIPASEVAKLEDRDMLKAVLVQVSKIINAINDYSTQIEKIKGSIEKEKIKMEDVRKNPPFTDEERKIFTRVIIGAAAIGFFAGGIIGAVVLGFFVAFVSYMILTMYYIERKDPRRGSDEAYKYWIKNIKPLEEQLTDVNASLNKLAESGQVAWAVDVVGEELFDSEAVNILYRIIDGRRADTMKEALNKYDEEIYRQNMRDMQLAAQQAAEAAVAEAIKQTNTLKNIEQNNAQTAKVTRASSMINILEHSSAQQQKKLLNQWKKDGLL